MKPKGYAAIEEALQAIGIAILAVPFIFVMGIVYIGLTFYDERKANERARANREAT